jgi:hypothetical protein
MKVTCFYHHPVLFVFTIPVIKNVWNFHSPFQCSLSDVLIAKQILGINYHYDQKYGCLLC